MPTARAWNLGATFGWLLAALLAELLVIAAAGFLYRAWSIAGGARPSDITVPAALLPMAAIVAGCCVIGITVVAARASGLSASDYLGLNRPRGRYLAIGLLALALSSAVPLVVAFGFGSGLSWPAHGPLVGAGAALLALRWFSSIVVASLWEELLFRGFLFRGLSDSRLGAAGAIAVPALLWALVHANRTWLGIVDLFLCGLLFGWVRWRTGSTITTIVVHALNNAVLLAIFTLA